MIRHTIARLTDLGVAVGPAYGIAHGACCCGNKYCQSPGKHPRPKNGLVTGSWVLSEVDPTLGALDNLLVRTGLTRDGDYLVVIDVDPRNGGEASWAKLILQHGAPAPTYTVYTGGGGWHYYYRSKTVIACSSGLLGPGIDVKGKGGVVIAAGSMHASGKTYDTNDFPIVAIPEWIVDAISNARSVKEGRNNTLTSIAGSLRRDGKEENEILEALIVENASKFETPLPIAEVTKIARSISSYPPAAVAPISEFVFLSQDEMSNDLPPIKWSVRDLGIAPGAVTIFGGEGYTGKTMALQSASVAMAFGLPVWGNFDCAQGICVHLDYEQGGRLLVDRYQRICRYLGVDIRDVAGTFLKAAAMPRLKLDNASNQDALKRALEGANLCIIDAFKGAFPSVQENDSNARSHLDMLHEVSEETGCAILVIAHSRKQGEDKSLKAALRGSSAIFDAAQTIYMLSSEPGKPVQVTCTKDRLSGENRSVFGLKTTDLAGPTGPRHALAVEYVSPELVREAYEGAENEDHAMAASIDRVSTLAERVKALIERNPDISYLKIRSAVNEDKNLRASLDHLIQRREIDPSAPQHRLDRTFIVRSDP